MQRSRTVALAATLAIFALVGCGGSTKTTTTTSSSSGGQTGASSTTTAPGPGTTPVAKGELVSEANAICRRIAARRASNRATTEEQAGAQAAELATFEHTTAGEFASYTPTSDFAADWHKLVAGAEQLAGYTAQIGEYAKAGQLNGSQAALAIQARRQLENELLALAKHNKMHDCAKSI